MKTLYIDVYFLINFTVDLLSLYFAAMFSKTPSTTIRLCLSALIGAAFAVFIVLMPEIPLLKFLLSTLCLVFIGLLAPRRVRWARRVKYLISFIIFEALVGGGVTFIWGAFDKYLSKYFSLAGETVVNRKMLIFSAIILLSIGVFKMIVSFFSNIESEGSVEIEIDFLGNKKRVEAFVDSGNLALDPMDMTPVLLLKKESAKDILPENIIELCDPDSLDRRVRRRIRLIPVTRGGSTHVLTGVKADSVKIVGDGREEEISVTVAIDKEGGSFGGFSALMPAAAINDVL